MTKEQSVLKSIMTAFEGENMKTQYSVLSYRTDLYFHDYKLAIEVDEKGHKDRNIDHEIKRQEAIKEKLGCEFIRINPDEENFSSKRVTMTNKIIRDKSRYAQCLSDKSRFMKQKLNKKSGQ